MTGARQGSPAPPPARTSRVDRASLTDAVVVAVQSAGNTLTLGVVALLTARVLGPSDRGLIVITVAAATLAMLVASCGANYAARVLVVAREPLPVQHVAALGLALCAAAVPLGTSVVHLAYAASSVDRPLWWSVGFGVYTAALLAVYLQREVLSALGATRPAAGLELTGAVVTLGGVVLLLFGLDVRTAGPVLAATALAAFVQIGVGALLWRRRGLPLAPQWSADASRRLLALGRRGVSIGLAQALAQRFDRLVVGAAVSTAAVGIYSVAVTVAEALWFVPMALGQVLSARLASRTLSYAELNRFRLGNVALAGGLALVAGLTAPFFVVLLFGEQFRPAVEPLRVLLLASVIAASYHVDILCVNATGRTGSAGLAAVLGATVVVGLNVLLIPVFGIVGAAWCSVAGYSVMAALAATALHRATTGDRRQAAA